MLLPFRLMVGLFGLITLLITVGSVPRYWSDAPGWLAASGGASVNYDIYRLLPDGRGVHPLTGQTRNELFPAWSPDGRALVFSSDRNGSLDLIKHNLRDGHETPLTGIPGADQAAVWSPDGQQIAYVTDHLGNHDIYVIPAAGGLYESGNVSPRVGMHRAQRLTAHPGHDDSPAWSPDGQWIAFAGVRSTDLATMYGVPVDVTTAATITGQYDLYRVRADGSGEEIRLTDSPGNDTRPTWSPDGQWIAFTSDRDGDRDIYRLRVADGVVEQLTDSPFVDISPTWSPDGQWIVFVSDRRGSYDLYRMRPDGSQKERITTTAEHEKTPVWGPPVSGRFFAGLTLAIGLLCFATGVSPRRIRQWRPRWPFTKSLT